MNLSFEIKLADKYTSLSQKIRVLTEGWVYKQVFCPNCGYFEIGKYENNKPVADFFCSNCREEYELKSKQKSIGTKVVDGAYRTMIERLKDAHNPNFFLLNYNLKDLSIINFFVIPKHFFVPDIIEKRKALSKTARRAGWVGCNILLNNIPESGKIFFVKNKIVEDKNEVLKNWQKTLFLRQEKEIAEKSWLLDIMHSIEKIRKQEFELKDIYGFEQELSKLHPENKHIKDKIRQQLQVLRDKGYLDFISRGVYKLVK